MSRITPDVERALITGFGLDLRREQFPADGPQLHERITSAAAAVGLKLGDVYRWRRRRFPRETAPDELKHLIVTQYGLASPHLQGKPLRATCEATSAEFGIHWRTIYRWRKALFTNGTPRRQPKQTSGRPLKLSPQVLEEIEYLHLHPGSHSISSAEMTRQLQSRFPDEAISYSAVYRQRKRLDDQYRLAREPAWRIEVPHLNFRWQIDDSLSDLFVQPDDSADRPRRVPLQCVMDERTRSYMAAHYVRTADRGTYAKLIFNACRRQSEVWPMCGVPETLLGDWGKVFKSDMARGALEAMGIREGDCRPYHPEGKGKVERGFRTIHAQFERMQPGWCPGDNKGPDAVDPVKVFRRVSGTWVDPRMDGQRLLTLDELNSRLREWVVVYHSQHHSTIGKAPLSMWQHEIQRNPELNVEPAEDILFRLLLVPVEGYTRRVDRLSVRYNNLIYFHEHLGDYEGMSIQVRYCYDDLKRVWCFDDRSRFICDAELLETFIVDDETDKRKFDQMARRARAAVKADKEAIQRIFLKPHAVVDLHERIHEGAKNAPTPLATEPGDWTPPDDPDAERVAAIRSALLNSRAANE